MNSKLIENRHIRVFISSTFRDMQDERDYLMKRTFPKLRRLAAERDVTLTELDLRWGITEEESKSGKVVEICLREIENSIPFFIGIIGNRYGWIPQKEDLGGNVTEHFSEVNNYIERHLSVTEMEIQFGVLSRDEDMHAFFFIKEQEEESDNLQMLNQLKEEVRRSKYPSSTYKSLEDLAAQIEKAFVNLLHNIFPDSNLTEIEKERIGQRSFLNQLCQNYIRDDKNFETLDTWLETKGGGHFVVTGASGLGKSALIANWVKEKLNSSSKNYNIIYHFTGNGGSESSSEHITRSLISEIDELYGWENADSENKLEDLFYRVSSEGNKPLLIVIDAINQIVDNDNAKLLNWIPQPTKNIKILFSTLEDDRTMEIFKNRNYPIYTLTPLDPERRLQLVKSYLRLYAKSLTEKQTTRIVTNPKCRNTLVLKTLLDELIKFGIYEKLDERIEYYLSSDTIDDFYQAFLASYEEEYGREYVEMILSIIAVSKYGLSEHEILDIVEGTPLAWSQIYCSFAPQLISKKGIISFSHIHVREAIAHRYLKDKEKSDKYRNKIITSFKTQDSPRIWEELLYQYYNLGDIKSLSNTLQNVRIFNSMIKSHAYEVALYMRSMINDGFDIYKYKEILNNEDDINRSYSSFLGFFVEYFSAYEFGLALCEDYERALKNNDNHLPSDESFEKLYIWKGRIYRSQANYTEALKAFSQAYSVCKKNYGVNHPYTLDTLIVSLSERSLTYQTRGNLRKALTYEKKVLDLDLKIYGKFHLHTATAFNNIGVIYEKLRNYQTALEYEEMAMEIRKRILGDYHLDTANSFNNVSRTYDELSNLSRAHDYEKKALEIKINILGENHPDTAVSFNNIGKIYGKLGDTQKELEYHEKALDVFLNIYGEEHPDTAQSFDNVGCTYKELGDHQKALEYQQRALKIRLNIFGEEHTDTANSLINIASTYGESGDHQKALQYQFRAWDILSKKRGMENSTIATCLDNIGLSYSNLGYNKKALEYYRHALDIRIKKLGEENLDTATSFINTGGAYEDLRDYPTALEYYRKALEVRVKIFGEVHSKIAETYECFVTLYCRIEEYNKAIEYTEKIITIIISLYGEKSFVLTQYYEYIGIFYQILKNYENSLDHISKAYEISKEARETESEAIYLNRLGRVYAIMGDKDTAKAKFKEAISLLPEDHPEAIDSRKRLNSLMQLNLRYEIDE